MKAGKKPVRPWIWVLVAVIILVVVIPLVIYTLSDIEKKELNDITRAQLGGSFARLASGVTHYELEGPADGQVVVLVHGSTIPMYIWDNQIDELSDAGFRVLRYDLYGKGFSDRPEAEYSQEFYRRQLLELLDHLDMRNPVDLVGLSIGGGLVVDFTANHPERVRKLVLASPMINSIRNDTNIKLLRPPVWGEFMMRMVATNSMAKRAAGLTAKSSDTGKYISLFREQTCYKGFESATLAMFRSDATTDYRPDYESVGKQDRQVMLIWGTLDEDISPEMVQAIRNSILGLRFEQLEGIGHNPEVDAADKFNSLVIGFLQ
ncbi:MAG: alpha/beta fold hydrolase [Dehalococcoidia bacterium]|nr:alpha/beta fold hydrolase [Dehalococcoidia bacterium]